MGFWGLVRRVSGSRLLNLCVCVCACMEIPLRGASVRISLNDGLRVWVLDGFRI